jgi:hypothetical protein
MTTLDGMHSWWATCAPLQHFAFACGLADVKGIGKRSRAEGAAADADEADGQAGKRARTAAHQVTAPAPASAASGPVGDTDTAMADEYSQQAESGPSGSKPEGQREWHDDQLTAFVKGFRPLVKEQEVSNFLKHHAPDGVKAVRMPRDPATQQSRVSGPAHAGSVQVKAPARPMRKLCRCLHALAAGSAWSTCARLRAGNGGCSLPSMFRCYWGRQVARQTTRLSLNKLWTDALCTACIAVCDVRRALRMWSAPQLTPCSACWP